MFSGGKMKNLGCGSLLVGLIVLGALISVAKDPIGGPILLIVLLAIVGAIAYSLLKPSPKQSSPGFPSGNAISRPQTIEERRSENLQRLAKALPNNGISPIPLKNGESLVYRIQRVSLIESRSNGSTYQGGSRGLSFRVAKGVSYRIGASKGQFVKNPESIQEIDHGTATFTNQRLIFAGTKASREWSFSKLMDISQTSDGQTIMISVSNRQKPSGIKANDSRDLDLGILAEIALEYNQNGLDAARNRCLSEAGVHEFVVNESLQSKTANSAENQTIDAGAAFGKGTYPARSAKYDSSSEARVAEGHDQVDVVGESFYAAAFEILRNRYNMEYGHSEFFELELVAEPFNKFSKNGHAVAVQLDGQIIGHISEEENTDFFVLLKSSNGRAKCQGEIYFAPVANVMKNSVSLFCDLPPVLEKGNQ
jgi:hypothetical protein